MKDFTWRRDINTAHIILNAIGFVLLIAIAWMGLVALSEMIECAKSAVQ